MSPSQSLRKNNFKKFLPIIIPNKSYQLLSKKKEIKKIRVIIRRKTNYTKQNKEKCLKIKKIFQFNTLKKYNFCKISELKIVIPLLSIFKIKVLLKIIKITKKMQKMIRIKLQVSLKNNKKCL